MKVKFSNAEVDVWKLRKGVVLRYGRQYPHLEGIQVYNHNGNWYNVAIIIEFADGTRDEVHSEILEWLEPHD